ncbi:hypothetical protein J6590_060721 [Homalodisca vitripennis]|nr:hypothetical protein J6590_060721 [Homalodisca vitripennis]
MSNYRVETMERSASSAHALGVPLPREQNSGTGTSSITRRESHHGRARLPLCPAQERRSGKYALVKKRLLQFTVINFQLKILAKLSLSVGIKFILIKNSQAFCFTESTADSTPGSQGGRSGCARR